MMKVAFGLDLDLLNILYKSSVSYPRRSGLLEKNTHGLSIYLRGALDGDPWSQIIGTNCEKEF